MAGNALARQACSFFLARLDAETNRLRGISFPGHDIGPRRWLNFIQGVLDTGRIYLEQSKNSALTERKANELIEFAEIAGSQAYSFLRHVTGADATEIPHEIVAPFQRWVKDLKIKNTIFFRAEHLPNYELGKMDASGFRKFPNATASLLNAIDDIEWAALLTRLDRIPDKGDNPALADSRRYNQLHQLLLKAVELAEARQLWMENS